VSGSLHADDARRVSGLGFRLFSDDWDELGEFETIVPSWSVGDEFMTGDRRRFRIVGMTIKFELFPCVQLTDARGEFWRWRRGLVEQAGSTLGVWVNRRLSGGSPSTSPGQRKRSYR
jgi:hypothetical protein